jgi:two-component system LytT family response regulator
MSKLRILIVDDEQHVREAIGQMVTLYCSDAEVVAEAAGVSEAVNAIKQHKPGIVLLDVDIKDGTGFDVLKQFPSPDFKVIFITAFQEYAVQAFRFSALDFLLKPLVPELLVEAIKKAQDVIDLKNMSLKIDSFIYNMDSLSKGTKKIILKTADTIHVINMQDIVYCEADRSYTNFYLSDKTRIMVSTTLGDYEDLFSGYGFLRIHQSYLLNVSYMKRYERGDGGKAVLVGDISLPVATRKKEQLLQLLSKL